MFRFTVILKGSAHWSHFFAPYYKDKHEWISKHPLFESLFTLWPLNWTCMHDIFGNGIFAPFELIVYLEKLTNIPNIFRQKQFALHIAYWCLELNPTKGFGIAVIAKDSFKQTLIKILSTHPLNPLDWLSSFGSENIL